MDTAGDPQFDQSSFCKTIPSKAECPEFDMDLALSGEE